MMPVKGFSRGGWFMVVRSSIRYEHVVAILNELSICLSTHFTVNLAAIREACHFRQSYFLQKRHERMGSGLGR